MLPRRSGKKGKRATVRAIVVSSAIIVLFSIAALMATAAYLVRSLPSVDDIANRTVAQSTRIYDRTGEVLLYEIHGEEKRTVIPFNEIPRTMKDATVAIEDKNFYKHSAFDWKATVRAVFKDLINFGKVQGGSTITQQLAKNAFLSSEKTVTRKIKELILAVKLERQYTKDEILGLYLNQIPYGSNSYGIEAAAKTYFDKSAKDLNIAEAALLAAIPKAPSYYSPWGSHVDELLQRKDYILDEMMKNGLVDDEQNKEAKTFKFKFAPHTVAIKAPHFVMAVQDYLSKKYGDDMLERGGLKVTTTLDWNLQQAAETAVKNGAERNTQLYKGKNAALFAEDPKTGQILAVVGSKDYFDTENEGNFNVAMQGLRQPGSSFKPLAYVTAFEKGYTPNTVLFDVPTEFDTTGIPKKSYKPENFDEMFRGPIALRDALAQSVNIPAVKVLYLSGIDNVLKTAKDFGITTLTERSRYGLSLVLGGGEVKLSEMVGAYSVFANDGVKHDQTLVLKVEGHDGHAMEEYRDNAAKVIEPQYARLINNILSDTEARRPLFQNSFDLTVFPGYDVALKTGTTDNYVDAWAMGYTPSIVVGVWAGNNHREPLQKKGGSILAAVPIWSEFMNKAVKNLPTDTFVKPDPITPDKPILRGDYTANKQIHTILYYVSKNDPTGPAPSDPASDPQFSNWEGPVISWARTNVPDFAVYNQSNTNINPPSQNDIDIVISTPQNGDFIDSKFNLVFQVNSTDELSELELYFNSNLLEKIILSGSSYFYNKTVEVYNLETQNMISVKVTTKNGYQKESRLILYKK